MSSGSPGNSDQMEDFFVVTFPVTTGYPDPEMIDAWSITVDISNNRRKELNNGDAKKYGCEIFHFTILSTLCVQASWPAVLCISRSHRLLSPVSPKVPLLPSLLLESTFSFSLNPEYDPCGQCRPYIGVLPCLRQEGWKLLQILHFCLYEGYVPERPLVYYRFHCRVRYFFFCCFCN